MIKITIKGEMTDLNTYIKAINGSRFSGNEVKQFETDRVAWEVKNKIKAIQDDQYPLKIKYKWFSFDERKDIDNVAFAKKFINDGLVKGGIIKNDSRKYIRSFSDEFYIDKNFPRVEIELESIEV
jgi:hypothetical protein